MSSPDGLFSMSSIRRSLRISKKDKDKKEKAREGEVPELPEEEEEVEKKKKKEEVVDRREEISEFYTLPEVLPTPLSGTVPKVYFLSGTVPKVYFLSGTRPKVSGLCTRSLWVQQVLQLTVGQTQ